MTEPTPRTDLLGAMLRKAQRALARTDVTTYIEYVTGMEPARHHRDMLDFAIAIVDAKKSGVMLAPRGSGKTTIITTGFLPWLIALRPDIRIGLFSQKAEKAEAMSAAIMETISESEEFIEIFGNLRGNRKWTASEWLRKDSPHATTKDRTMVTGGAAQSSSAVSKRFDLLILDDVLDENNTATIDQREKLETWFWKTLKPTQAAEGCAVLVIGCLATDTPVLMADGTWKRIDDVEAGESVWSTDETGAAGPRLVEASLDQGVAEVLSVRTAKTEVVATPWHPFLVARNGGLEWVRADEITTDDFLVEVKETPGVVEHSWMTDDFCWLLGFLFGDGWVGSTQKYVACALGADEELNGRVLAALREWFPLTSFYPTPFGYVRCDSPVVARALDGLGFRGNAKTKRIPDWVFRSTPEFRRAFLRGFSDADGHWMKKSTDTARIEIANQDLLDDLWRLALTCGVRPTAIGHRERISQPPHSAAPITSHAWSTSLNFAMVGTTEYAPKGQIAKNVKRRWHFARLSARKLGSGFRIVPVVSVSPAGERHVWDLTVEGTHAFVARGLVVHNTRWVEDDLYQKLIESNKWPALIIPAISVDPETSEEVSYWPQVWPLERLYAEREDVGWDNFACSYLNDISGLREGTIFRREWWKDHYFETLPNDRTFIYTIGIDLASSERERADWTTGVVVAEDDRHEHWVLYHTRVKTDSGHREFVQGVNRWAADHGYPVSRIIIENNQHQSTLVQDLLHQTSLPVVGRRADVDKRTRARATAARYESHRVHHHESLRGRELETEMLGFPKGHDDLVDALGLAMDISGVSGSIAGVNGRLRDAEAVTGPVLVGPSEMLFRDGPRAVPAHVKSMLTGIDTETCTYEEAVRMMNANRLTDYIRGVTKGMLRGR